MPFDSTDFLSNPEIDINSKEARLRHLIEILKSVPPAQFNMNNWRCKTSACAAGWAGIDSLFNSMGFYSHESGNCIGIIYTSPRGLIYEYTSACMKFFQLTLVEAEYIFIPGTYQNRQTIKISQVIARIESLLKGKLNYAF